MEELRKKGYLAGITSLIFAFILIVVGINSGWNLSGQITGGIGLIFVILGASSLWKPESIGQVVSDILENMAKNAEKDSQSINHSPYSTQQKAGRDIITVNNYGKNSAEGSEGIKDFKKKLDKKEQFLENKGNEESLSSKIEEYLDESKPISIIAEMCLRLAKKLNMKNDEKWLLNEVYGFEELSKDQDSKNGLKMREVDEDYSYRSIEAEFTLQANNGVPQTFPLKMFISQPLIEIENWIKKFHNHSSPTQDKEKMIMWAPPLELMVETFKVSPEKNVPYIVKISGYEKIIQEVRRRLLKFLEKANEELK